MLRPTPRRAGRWHEAQPFSGLASPLMCRAWSKRMPKSVRPGKALSGGLFDSTFVWQLRQSGLCGVVNSVMWQSMQALWPGRRGCTPPPPRWWHESHATSACFATECENLVLPCATAATLVDAGVAFAFDPRSAVNVKTARQTNTSANETTRRDARETIQRDARVSTTIVVELLTPAVELLTSVVN